VKVEALRRQVIVVAITDENIIFDAGEKEGHVLKIVIYWTQPFKGGRIMFRYGYCFILFCLDIACVPDNVGGSLF